MYGSLIWSIWAQEGKVCAMFNFFKSVKGNPAKPKAKPKPKAQEVTAKTVAPKALPSRQSSPPQPLPPPGGAATPGTEASNPTNSEAPTLDMPTLTMPALTMPALTMTAERAKLIEKALSVYRTKQDVFADLDPKDRQKLMVMAMLTLLPRGNRNG